MLSPSYGFCYQLFTICTFAIIYNYCKLNCILNQFLFFHVSFVFLKLSFVLLANKLPYLTIILEFCQIVLLIEKLYETMDLLQKSFRIDFSISVTPVFALQCHNKLIRIYNKFIIHNK